ncbi:MAG: 30S ribosome-binding factor RbfA [Planctomycetota bacterium]
MASDRRVQRLTSSIVRESATFIARRLNDPRIGPVTVTGAKLSTDLSHCKVLVMPSGDEKQRKITMMGLQSALPALQRHLAEALDIRFAPQVTVEVDAGMIKAREMDEIFRKIREEGEKKQSQADTPLSTE